MEKIVQNAVKYIKNRITKTPEVAAILGSGLNDVLDNMQNKVIIPYKDIKGLPRTTVEGHKNQFVIGDLFGKTVIAMQGRFHLYDGFTAKQVVLPIYIFKELGIKTLIVTNAAGGVNASFKVGDIMLITDHINHTYRNCMIGGPIIDYGNPFVAMIEPYKKEYCELVKEIAKQNDIALREGTYIQYIGPFYETNADIRVAHTLGADAVGMSTAVEVEAAKHCGIDVVGFSVITDMAVGEEAKEQCHKDILEVSKKSGKYLSKIIIDFIKQI